MNYSELICGIHNSIKSELRGYEYYKILAEKSSSDENKEMILHFAKDERNHAILLKDAYYKLTGKIVEIEVEIPFVPEYSVALYESVISEISDSEKYREYYLSTKIDWLRDLLFKTLNDEFKHAIRQLLIISSIK